MGNWLKRLAVLAVLGFPLCVVLYRLGLYDFGVAFKIIAVTFIVSLVVFLVSIVVSLVQRNKNPESAKYARTASMLCLLPMIGVGSQAMTGSSLPQIHNISTDLVNPPQFNKIVQIRTAQHNPLEYDIDTIAPLQKSAYPNIKTLIVTMDKQRAHGRAIAVAEELGWKVVDDDLISGLIEATESTLIWNFKDDVVIRINELGNGQVAVDLRSVSRIGRSDLGANAKRIEKFIQRFNAS